MTNPRNELRIPEMSDESFSLSNAIKILTICIMKFNSLHYALLAVVVLLTVYCSTLYFREGAIQGRKAAGFINIVGELSSEVSNII